jgi:hypothetical protein
MKMKDLPTHRRQEIITLEILWRNFKEQNPTPITGAKVELEIPLGDAGGDDSVNISAETFCRIVRSFNREDIKINSYDRSATEDETRHSDSPSLVTFCSVTVPANFEEIYERLLREARGENIRDEIDDAKLKIIFDQTKGILRYGHVQHNFQKGNADKKERLALMRLLWKKRQHAKGKTTINGEKMQRSYVAVLLGLAEDASNFNRDPKAKMRLKNLINGINRELRAKKIPAKINGQDGIQLIVKEK